MDEKRIRQCFGSMTERQLAQLIAVLKTMRAEKLGLKIVAQRKAR